jgi:hypothetical protein
VCWISERTPLNQQKLDSRFCGNDGRGLIRRTAQMPVNQKSQISAVPLQVEQAQLDTWIDIGRLIVEVGKTL